MSIPSNKYFEVEAEVFLYDSSRGRKSFIANNYRAHVWFGVSEPTNPNLSSDCVLNLLNRDRLYPGEVGKVKLLVLQFDHLRELLQRNFKIKLKEGGRFVGEGTLTSDGECKSI